MTMDISPKERARISRFLICASIVLVGTLVTVVWTATGELESFTSECTALKGEIARKDGHLICIDPNHILKEQHDSHEGGLHHEQ